MRFRISQCGHSFVFLAMLAGAAAVTSQTPDAKAGAAAPGMVGLTQNDMEVAALIKRLVLNAPRGPLDLKPEERARMIETLVEAQQGPNIVRPFLNHFMLALLGYHYEEYRDEFLQQWTDCCADGGGGHNDEISAVLIRLYEEGHKELLRPLLAGGRSSEAMENDINLGEFYRAQMENEPLDFVAALATFTPGEQRALCTAAAQSGNGLESAGEIKVLANLKQAGGDVSDRCALGVKEGVQDFTKKYGFPPKGP